MIGKRYHVYVQDWRQVKVRIKVRVLVSNRLVRYVKVMVMSTGEWLIGSLGAISQRWIITDSAALLHGTDNRQRTMAVHLADNQPQPTHLVYTKQAGAFQGDAKIINLRLRSARHGRLLSLTTEPRHQSINHLLLRYLNKTTAGSEPQ